MSGHTKKYREYLESFQWYRKREDALSRSGHKCQRCGVGKDLEVHHKHYKNLGNEQPDDLEVLCIPCHRKADVQRRSCNHRLAGMYTYAVKKYGEDWQSIVDPDQIADEFDDWRERHQDS